MTRFDFKAIGTSWRVDILQDFSVAESEALREKIMSRIDIFDKAYSRFRADSLVTEMSKKSGTYRLPDDAKPMMRIYRDLYLRTGGLVTPLIGNLISDAGYDAGYSLVQKGPLKSPLSWDEAIWYDEPNLEIKKPVMLDFGAAGKGYLIDIVGGVLEENNAKEFTIDAGGDILRRGGGTEGIGLENPQDTKQAVGVATLGSGSLCGSAGTRRKWGDFTHIINPKTLASPKDIIAVWTLADTALVADAIATCLFFVPAERVSDGYDFEYAVLRSDMSIERSRGFPGKFFAPGA